MIDCIAAVWLCATAAACVTWTVEDLTLVSGPASPRVAYALRRTAGQLWIVVDVESGEGSSGSVTLGASAGQHLILDGSKATAERTNDGIRYTFKIPQAALIDRPADWDRFRFAFAVTWSRGSCGQDRQREHFFELRGAAFDSLSTNPQDWKPFDDPPCDALGFQYSFHEDHDAGGWGRHLWLYGYARGIFFDNIRELGKTVYDTIADQAHDQHGIDCLLDG